MCPVWELFPSRALLLPAPLFCPTVPEGCCCSSSSPSGISPPSISFAFSVQFFSWVDFALSISFALSLSFPLSPRCLISLPCTHHSWRPLARAVLELAVKKHQQANRHPKVLSTLKLFPGCETKPGGGQPVSRWADSLAPRRRSRVSSVPRYFCHSGALNRSFPAQLRLSNALMTCLSPHHVNYSFLPSLPRHGISAELWLLAQRGGPHAPSHAAASGWGCAAVTRGAPEGIFGAAGGRSIQVVKQAQEQSFRPFSSQPAWALALRWMLSARGDAGLVKGSKDKSSGQRRFGGFKHPDCSEHKQTELHPAPCFTQRTAANSSLQIPEPCLPFGLSNLPVPGVSISERTHCWR